MYCPDTVYEVFLYLSFRFVFWFEKTTEDDEYSIKRTSLDNDDGIYTFPFQLEDPVAMAIDSAAETVYWALEDGVIGKSSFDGSNANTNIFHYNESNFNSIALFGDYLYICVANAKTVVRINKDQDVSTTRGE